MNKTRVFPPEILLLALAAMIGLHTLWPEPRLGGAPVQLVGGALTLAGVSLSALAAGLFRRRGTAVRPFAESSLLVVDGPYRFTRNPMYLGMTMILTGVGLALGSVIPLVMVPLFIGTVTVRFIRVEEQLLSARFGKSYDDFRSRVRRWL